MQSPVYLGGLGHRRHPNHSNHPNLPPHTPMAYDTLSFLDAQSKAYNTNPNNSTVQHATSLTCPLPGGDMPSLKGCASGSGTSDTDPLRPVRTYRGTVGGYHVFTNRCWDRDGMSRMSGSDIRLPCRLEPGQTPDTRRTQEVGNTALGLAQYQDNTAQRASTMRVPP